MNKVTKAITVAVGILVTAATILQKASDYASRFVQKNTPECALVTALGTAYQAWSTGNLPTGAAALMAFSALMTFVITESSKDSRTTSPTLP